MSLRDKTIILLLMLFSFIGAAQKSITLTKLDQNTLPKQISYTGKIKTAVRWPDALGDNLVIITETGESYSKHAPADSIYRDAALYAYHFILIGTKVKPAWKVYDFIKSCPVDIAANFVNDEVDTAPTSSMAVSLHLIPHLIQARRLLNSLPKPFGISTSRIEIIN